MITAQQVKEAMIEKGIYQVEIGKCSFCGYRTKYERDGENISFDEGCYCVGNRGPYKPRTWEHVAELINMQTEERRGIMAAKFGITGD